MREEFDKIDAIEFLAPALCQQISGVSQVMLWNIWRWLIQTQNREGSDFILGPTQRSGTLLARDAVQSYKQLLF